eukprot:9527397-Alexandrium_andersonii.AAC.1
MQRPSPRPPGPRQPRERVDALIVEAGVAVGQVSNRQPCPDRPSQPVPRSDQNPSRDQLPRP